MRAARVLTLCQGGNSRSVAMARVLKYHYGLDAIACSWERNSAETISMLAQWADQIFVMRTGFERFIPAEFRNKVRIMDVGDDRWDNGSHPELVELCDSLLLEAAKA